MRRCRGDLDNLGSHKRGKMSKVLRRCVFAAAVGVFGTAGFPIAADPIKVGAIFSLTGTYAMTELPARKAARLAVKEINEKGGIKGRPI